MPWLRRMQNSVTRPFYFYRWQEGRYVLEQQGSFPALADAQAEACRIVERLGDSHHLHILDQDHRLVETIGAPPPTMFNPLPQTPAMAENL